MGPPRAAGSVRARGPSGGPGLRVGRRTKQCPACGGRSGAGSPLEIEITGMPGEGRRAGPRPSVDFVLRQLARCCATALHGGAWRSRCCVRRRRAARQMS